jgi:hypothetical protein
MKPKNTNDLVYAIAALAKELGNKPMRELRRWVESDMGPSATRGDLIEQEILDEFIEEFPREIEEPDNKPSKEEP